MNVFHHIFHTLFSTKPCDCCDSPLPTIKEAVDRNKEATEHLTSAVNVAMDRIKSRRNYDDAIKARQIGN